MKKRLLTLALLTQCSVMAFAQSTDTLMVQTVDSLSSPWHLLDSYNYRDARNCEMITDLGMPVVTDPQLTRRYQRHHFFLGFLLPLLDMRWQAVKMSRCKWVGTCVHNSVHSGPLHVREYDANFDIVPHLLPYKDMSDDGYQAMLSKGRVNINRVGTPPFVRSGQKDQGYSVHCECTPPRYLRQAIHARFYPYDQKERDLKSHPNFGYSDPSFGMYGPFVLDCNHRCHPEIHPYEWIWWIDKKPEVQAPDHIQWYLALLRDDSGRMQGWQHHQRTGELSIPFTLNKNKSNGTIHIETLVQGKLNLSGLNGLSTLIPPRACDFANANRSFVLIKDQKAIAHLTVLLNQTDATPALRYWIGELQEDKNGLISGRLHIAASVKDVYSARVSFDRT